jgi:DNA integrity scanning protein DisA with diadenylate cyclase activity
MPVSLNDTMLEFAYRVADEIGARAVMLYGDAIGEGGFLNQGPGPELILVTGKGSTVRDRFSGAGRVLTLPDMKMTRIGQVKTAVTSGIAAGLFRRKDKIVCLTGMPQFGYIDSLMIIDVEKEFEILGAEDVVGMFEGIKPEVFESVLNIALELGAQGREGRSIGTVFILGDHERVLRHSRQMIINPFAGYGDDEKNILNPALKETIREFSALDGAFIIKDDGVLVSAGTYLSAVPEGEELLKGLGSRHLAAAGITSVTDSVAIVVSESTGTVRVFKKGKIFVSIEKPV